MKSLLMFPLYLLVNLLGVIFVPIGLLFLKNNKMPFLIDFFWGNDEDSIDGDSGWKNEHCKGNSISFKCRYIWLAIRNPAHNFCYVISTQDQERKYRWFGNDDYRICYLTSETKDMFYFTIPNRFNGKKIECYLGWKLFNEPKPNKDVMYGIRFSLNKTSLHSGMEQSWINFKNK